MTQRVCMDFKKRYMILLLSSIFLSGCGSHEVYRESSIASKPYHAPVLNSNTKQIYLNVINKARSQERSCGSAGNFSSAAPLKWSDVLYKASYEHSHDMARSNHFSHIGSFGTFDWTANVQKLGKGSSFKERIENNGYKKWKNIAENIAMGSSTIDQVMVQWLSSDQHCANIMNPDFTDIGAASVKKEGTHSIYYWTQTFAAHQ